MQVAPNPGVPTLLIKPPRILANCSSAMIMTLVCALLAITSSIPLGPTTTNKMYSRIASVSLHSTPFGVFGSLVASKIHVTSNV